jgi:hypothetical protein
VLEWQHRFGDLRHERHPQHFLCDLLGVIADVLEILSNPEGANEVSQVDRHWLSPGHRHDHYILDLALHRVDRIA